MRNRRYSYLTLIAIIVAGMVILGFEKALAQTEEFAPRKAVEVVVISFEVQKLIKEDILVQYDGDTIYVPLTRVFRLLEINITPDRIKRIFSGQFLSKKNSFKIDMVKMRVRAPNVDYKLTPADYILKEEDLYLRVDLFNRLFALPMVFDFNLLRVFMRLDKDLPIYKRLERQIRHEKLIREKRELGAVSQLPRRWQSFSGGVLDWTVSTSPLGGGGQFARLNLGGVVLGGDIEIRGSGNTRSGIDPRQFTGRWRYFFEDSRFFESAIIGDFFSSGALARSLRGASVTNSPIRRRKHFQTISLEGELGEGWEVELYINNKLTDFARTDHTGHYEFDLDVLYGSSLVRLQMYGPNGELQTEERYINVPYDLLPKGELEYAVSAGRDRGVDSSAYYVNSRVRYGATSWLSMGIGGDVPLSPLADEKMLFAGEISAQAAKTFSFNASFAPNAEVNFGMIYTRPSRLGFSGGYRKFFENKLRNRRLQKDRISFGVSAPFHLGGKTFGLRLNGNINRYPTYTSSSFSYGASAPLRPVQLNFLGRYTINKIGEVSNSVITTQLIATINALRWFRPQIRLEYDHTNTQLVKYGIFIGKRVFRTGQLALNYERNNFTESNQITLTFNLYTNYAHIQSRSIAVRDQIVVNQVYRGSIQYDQSSKSVRFDKDNAVGLGAVVVRPFLDVNYNGAFDAGEESVSGLWAKVRGSSGQRRKSDNLYFYERLQPYYDLLIEIDAQSLDDPILKPTNENYNIKVTPNMITTIDIPVVTTSDISGKVTRMTEHGVVGAGGVRILILNISSDIVTEVTSFNDGEFFYFGLLPGKYRVYLDSKQLAESGYRSDSDGRNFEILPKQGGESLRGVNFNMIPIE